VRKLARPDRRGLDVLPCQRGQVNVVRYGVKTVRSGGAIPLATGLAAQFPSPGMAIISAVNAAVEEFVRAAAAESSLAIRVSAVSRGWVSEHCRRWAAIRRMEFRPPR
jgi:NAD(P)-dependent dehydrogenase (short-subunit alcohol dehydrogenase family)